MNVQEQIQKYITGQPEPKRSDLQVLHDSTGLSANKTGISVYILGIEDKKYLAETYGKGLGKASVTGYCIRFKALKNINLEILEAAMRYEFESQNEKAT